MPTLPRLSVPILRISLRLQHRLSNLPRQRERRGVRAQTPAFGPVSTNPKLLRWLCLVRSNACLARLVSPHHGPIGMCFSPACYSALFFHAVLVCLSSVSFLVVEPFSPPLIRISSTCLGLHLPCSPPPLLSTLVRVRTNKGCTVL